MELIYFSKTGNIKRFIHKIENNAISGNADLLVNKPFILITYTTGMGQVPAEVDTFCENNKGFLMGVIASGNKNWGSLYGLSADIISDKYNVPVLMKFELSGNIYDIEKFKEIYKGMVKNELF